MTKGIFIFVIGISIVMFGLNVGMSHIESQSSSVSRFEVIDTYQGCDVVQYLPEYSGRYYFFLHCK